MYISLGYSFPAGSSGCRAEIIDSSGGYTYPQPQPCDTSFLYFEHKANCNRWQLVLRADSAGGCGPLVGDTLVFNLCDTLSCLPVYRPIFLGGAAMIPAFLACDYRKPCISCGTLDSLLDAFGALYPAFDSSLYLTPKSDTQYARNALCARFLNYRTGFSKGPLDYIAARKLCHPPLPATVPSTQRALCSSDRPLNDTVGFTVTVGPCDAVGPQAAALAERLFQLQKDSLLRRFDSLYKALCYSAQYREKFTARYAPNEYHYTLYWYDQAGNLLKTLPPAAVRPNRDSLFLDSVARARAAGTTLYNGRHRESLATQYRYNTLNQVASQISPDGGTATFYYDRLGRLAASRNAKQAGQGAFSYTKYDPLGRIVEVGQIAQSAAPDSRNEAALATWLTASATQVTATVYDTAYGPLQTVSSTQTGLFQQHLRNRVSYTYVRTFDSSYLWDAATFYSYDIHGNVDTLLQDYRTGLGAITCLSDTAMPSGNRFKKVVYDYDLISGKVNGVAYQPGQRDQFYHRYSYDAENRLTGVETSRDKVYWEHDAAYSYYRHGPLARTGLGELGVQGVDYAYTIQGWLKGVNSTLIPNPGAAGGAYDMGKDGFTGTHALVAKDVFGFALHYYGTTGTGDYTGIGQGTGPYRNPFANPVTSGGGGTGGSFFSLYNGNIAAMSVNLPKVGVPMLYAYRYDQLNRITAMSPFKLTVSTANVYTATTSTQDYKESGIKYDPSGNILAYGRNGNATTGGALAMDQLTYWYYYYTSTGQRKQYNPQAGIPADAARLTNQLASVKDTVSKDNYTRLEGTEDVDNMPDTAYSYDAIGNMTENRGDSINQVGWNVYGKIAYLTKTVNGVLRTTVYQYDASGNRISKAVGSGKTTYYVRDAQGNVLSTYEYTPNDTLRQTELHLYGSSRLGTLTTRLDVQDCNLPSTDTSVFVRGYKQYELSNHLGNVLATISDRHFGVDSNANGTTDYYVAEVVTEQDYYPFGMQMPGRKYPNYQPAPPAGGGGGPTSPIELYRHSFTTPATSHVPYTATPDLLTAYIDSSKWTATNNRLAGVLIPAGGSDYGLQLDSSNTVLASDLPTNSAVAYTLTLYVKPAYRLSLTGWSASIMRYTNNGFGKWRLFVNGNGVAIYSATTPTTLTGIGGTFSSQINGLTGTVKIQLGLTEKTADTAKFLLDNFALNGFVQKIPTSADIGLGGTNAEKYRYGFNGQERDNEIGNDSYGALYWEYDGRIGRRWNCDPKPLLGLSHYAVFGDNPIWFVDKRGDSSVIDDRGYVKHYDPKDKDLRVFMQQNGKLVKVGELGGQIDANVWFKNLVVSNTSAAIAITSPVTFMNYVKKNGRWDYKSLNQSNERVGKDLKPHILGLAFYRHDKETNKSPDLPVTNFTFTSLSARTEDLNNMHFGIVGKSLWFATETMLMIGAGEIEIQKWAKQGKIVPPSWGYVEVRHSVTIEHGMKTTITEYAIIPPYYGDNPMDNLWIRKGFKYYKDNDCLFNPAPGQYCK